jgi:hypothetical protein
LVGSSVVDVTPAVVDVDGAAEVVWGAALPPPPPVQAAPTTARATATAILRRPSPMQSGF